MASAAQNIQQIPPKDESRRSSKPPAKVLLHPKMKAEIEMFERLLLAEPPMPAKEKASEKPQKKDESDYVKKMERKFEKEESEENNKYLKILELKVASL